MTLEGWELAEGWGSTAGLFWGVLVGGALDRDVGLFCSGDSAELDDKLAASLGKGPGEGKPAGIDEGPSPPFKEGSKVVGTDVLDVVLVSFKGGGIVTRSKLKHLPGVFPSSATKIG